MESYIRAWYTISYNIGLEDRLEISLIFSMIGYIISMYSTVVG